MQILYENPHLTIQQDAANDCLFLTWRGQHPAGTIKAESANIIAHVERTQSRCLLNDASLDLDGWGGFISWFAQVFYPELAAAGIQAIAWVLPHNLRALADAKNVLNLVEHAQDYRPDCPETNTFGDVESAYSWLRQTAARR